MMALTQDELIKRLLQARKIGETPDWAIIGKDPDNAGNPFQAQVDTGETNVVYATVKGNPDPQIIYYDPSADLRLLQYGARVEIEWRNGKAWLKGADKEFLTEQQAGTPLPTGNVPLPEHDHTDANEGGTLGADTVNTTQLVDSGVTTAKIADANVTLAKLASNSVNSSKIVDGSVTGTDIASATIANSNMAANSVDTTQIVDDAVTPTKTDGLSGASAAFVLQTAADAFSSIDYQFATNSRLFYDGTKVRRAYQGKAQPSGSNIATSGTTELDLQILSIASANISNTSTLRVACELSISGGVVGDLYRIKLQYLSTAPSTYTEIAESKLYQVEVASAVKTVTYNWLVDQSALGTAPATSSGNYQWKTTIVRISGTGAATIRRGTTNPSSLIILEV